MIKIVVDQFSVNSLFSVSALLKLSKCGIWTTNCPHRKCPCYGWQKDLWIILYTLGWQYLFLIVVFVISSFTQNPNITRKKNPNIQFFSGQSWIKLSSTVCVCVCVLTQITAQMGQNLLFFCWVRRGRTRSSSLGDVEFISFCEEWAGTNLVMQLSQICTAAGMNRSDAKYSQVSILLFCIVYSSWTHCVKAFMILRFSQASSLAVWLAIHNCCSQSIVGDAWEWEVFFSTQ